MLFIIDVNHDYKSVSQGCISEFKDYTSISKLKRKGQILIQNDCWIGNGVTIFGGVTVHNDAVIAAGSVVTKDVPPYAIVGGNPARIIKYRFDDDIISKLQSIAWWNWDSQKLKKYQSDKKGIAFDVSSQERACAVIDCVNDVTKYVSSERGRLGAIQNRLEYNIESTTNAVENITSSRSKINDADMAMEYSELTKYNILNQMAQAMLKQGNEQYQKVLDFIQPQQK